MLPQVTSCYGSSEAFASTLDLVAGRLILASRAIGSGDTTDNKKILRNDLLVVAAGDVHHVFSRRFRSRNEALRGVLRPPKGPSTHFLQAPAWALILWLLFAAYTAGGTDTGYDSAWHAVLDSLNPMGGGYSFMWTGSRWSYLPFSVAQSAIRLNVAPSLDLETSRFSSFRMHFAIENEPFRAVSPRFHMFFITFS